jgi:signal transduction histidine kinase
LNDFLLRTAALRGAPLPERLLLGASSAIGAFLVLALGWRGGDTPIFAIFLPFLQLAALLGGTAATAPALVGAVVIRIWIGPSLGLGWDVTLFAASAALAGLAGAALPPARESRAPEEEPAQAGDDPAARRTFDAVAAAIAHDVNQPLAAAVAYLHTARRFAGATEPAPPSVAETLDKAAAQLTRAGRLVTHLREFLVHGPPRFAPLGLNALVRETIGPHRGDLAAAPKLDARRDEVCADRTQIEQLLMDILAAAANARATAPTVATSSDAATASVAVTFAPPSDSASVEPERWSVDISIWRAVVEANRGVFRVDRRPDGGLTVAFALPLASSPGE